MPVLEPDITVDHDGVCRPLDPDPANSGYLICKTHDRPVWVCIRHLVLNRAVQKDIAARYRAILAEAFEMLSKAAENPEEPRENREFARKFREVLDGFGRQKFGQVQESLPHSGGQEMSEDSEKREEPRRVPRLPEIDQHGDHSEISINDLKKLEQALTLRTEEIVNGYLAYIRNGDEAPPDPDNHWKLQADFLSHLAGVLDAPTLEFFSPFQERTADVRIARDLKTVVIDLARKLRTSEREVVEKAVAGCEEWSARREIPLRSLSTERMREYAEENGLKLSDGGLREMRDKVRAVISRRRTIGSRHAGNTQSGGTIKTAPELSDGEAGFATSPPAVPKPAPTPEGDAIPAAQGPRTETTSSNPPRPELSSWEQLYGKEIVELVEENLEILTGIDNSITPIFGSSRVSLWTGRYGGGFVWLIPRKGFLLVEVQVPNMREWMDRLGNAGFRVQRRDSQDEGTFSFRMTVSLLETNQQIIREIFKAAFSEHRLQQTR
jgi:hypothetical protein